MKWPFSRRSRDSDFSVEASNIPVSTLIRWFIYDIGFEDPNKLATKLSLLPVSEEGNEKEQADSEERLAKVVPVLPFVKVMAAINAKAALELQAQVFETVGITLKEGTIEYEAMLEFYEKVSLTALLTGISAANQLGLVEVSGIYTAVEEH